MDMAMAWNSKKGIAFLSAEEKEVVDSMSTYSTSG